MYIFVLVYFFNFIYHLTKPLNIAKYVLMTELTTTETCQKYSVTVIFYYIFHIKPQFLETLFQSQFLFDFDDFFTNKNRIKCSFTL